MKIPTLAAAFLICCRLDAAEPEQPLAVVNPGFEIADADGRWPEGWRPRSHVGAANHRFAETARTGTRAAEIAFDREATGYFYSTPVPLPLCASVKASAWCRARAKGKGAYLLLYFQDVDNSYIGGRVSSRFLTDAEEWERLTVEGSVPPGARFVLLALQFDGPGTAVFDDVVMSCRPLAAEPALMLDSPVGQPLPLGDGGVALLGSRVTVDKPVLGSAMLTSRAALPGPVIPIVAWFAGDRQLGVAERPAVYPLNGEMRIAFDIRPRPLADTARPGFRFASNSQADGIDVRFDAGEPPSPVFATVADMSPGAHPRLFAPRDSLPAVRRRFLDAAPDSPMGRLWSTIRNHADESLVRTEIKVYSGRYGTTLPPALPPEHPDRFPYWTGLSRQIEKGMQTMATAYLVTGDETYGRKAVEWALAVAAWPYWTDPSYSSNGSCLDTSHFCHGTAVVYDYCYDLLTDDQRHTLRDAMLEKGAAGVMRDATEGWAKTFGWPNGFAVVMGGMGIAGAVTLGDDERAPEYVRFARRRLWDFLDSRDRDGGYIEGLLYGGYAMTHITPFAEALRNLGDDTLARHPYWAKTMRFAATCLSPATATHVNFCDANRNSSVYWTTALLRAAERDPVARWFLNVSNFGSSVGDWGLTYAVTAAGRDLGDAPAPDLPVSAVYRDIGWVVHRSGFAPSDMILALRSGPPGSHCQYDQNSWQLCVAGEWLGHDPGYGKRDTALHNTLLVNGSGQANAGGQISGFASLPSLQYSRHEADACYPDLARFTRHALLIGREYALLIDDIAPADADATPAVESRMHMPLSDGADLLTEPHAIVMSNAEAALRITIPQMAGISLESGETAVSRFAALQWNGAAVVPMVLSPGDAQNPVVDMTQRNGTVWVTVRRGAIEDWVVIRSADAEDGAVVVMDDLTTDAAVTWVRRDDGARVACAILDGTRLGDDQQALIDLERRGDCGWQRRR